MTTIRDLIERIDYSKYDPEWSGASISIFTEALNLGYHHDIDDKFGERVKVYPLIEWRCTDTMVGLRVFMMDGQPVATSWQEARKSHECLNFTSREARTMVLDFILSLLGEELDKESTFINLDEPLTEEFRAEVEYLTGKPLAI